MSESLLQPYLSPDNASPIWVFDEDVILHTPSECRIGLCFIARNGWVLQSKHRSGEKIKARERLGTERRTLQKGRYQLPTRAVELPGILGNTLIEYQLLCWSHECKQRKAFSTPAYPPSQTWRSVPDVGTLNPLFTWALTRMRTTRIPSAFMRVIRAGNPANLGLRVKSSCRSM